MKYKLHVLFKIVALDLLRNDFRKHKLILEQKYQWSC